MLKTTSCFPGRLSLLLLQVWAWGFKLTSPDSGFAIFNFGQISHIALVFPLLTTSKYRLGIFQVQKIIYRNLVSFLCFLTGLQISFLILNEVTQIN